MTTDITEFTDNENSSERDVTTLVIRDIREIRGLLGLSFRPKCRRGLSDMESRPPIRYRKLRIAWSMAWGLLAVLLILLWARSYQVEDELRYRLGSSGRWLVAETYPGGLSLMEWRLPPQWAFLTPKDSTFFDALQPITWWGIATFQRPNMSQLYMPYWTAIAAAAVIASVWWLPLRFSLLTLLFATTLVAVVLGLIVWGASVKGIKISRGADTRKTPAGVSAGY